MWACEGQNTRALVPHSSYWTLCQRSNVQTAKEMCTDVSVLLKWCKQHTQRQKHETLEQWTSVWGIDTLALAAQLFSYLQKRREQTLFSIRCKWVCFTFLLRSDRRRMAAIVLSSCFRYPAAKPFNRPRPHRELRLAEDTATGFTRCAFTRSIEHNDCGCRGLAAARMICLSAEAARSAIGCFCSRRAGRSGIRSQSLLPIPQPPYITRSWLAAPPNRDSTPLWFLSFKKLLDEL